MERTGWKPTETPDRELIERARRGEREAFSVLVCRYEQGLLAHIRRYLSGNEGRQAGQEAAEEPRDLCQETFRKAFLHIGEYNPDYEFSTWLFSIGRNTAIDHSRQRRIAAPGLPAEPGSSSPLPGGEVHLSPEEQMIGSQQYESLIRHIGSLGPLYREVARLRFIHEYAYEEIARELDLPLNTVRTRIKRAKALLLKKMDS